MSAESSRAVFLSYASEDAEAARGISDALRTAGVEVWFDKSELVGGDAWDQKIRKQIKECALFLPVISENTQARREGYFRLEWKLAAHRTHTMADGTPFVVPVVIDTTRDAEALVPDEFRVVQWTQLSGGETSNAFVDHVKSLLSDEGVARAFQPVGPEKSNVPHGVRVRATAPVAQHRNVRRLTAIVAAAAVVAAGAFYISNRASNSSAPPNSKLQTSNSKLQTPNSKPPESAPAKSVAVLPFTNLSGDREQEYFSDGLTEEILSALRRERDLTVPGNTSCFAFKERKAAGLEIANALNVSRLVEGSVQRVGTRVRIRVTLSRPADNSSEELGTFTEELADIFALQDKVARAVVAKLTRRAPTAPVAVLTRNSDAYDAYLRGRALQTRYRSTPEAEKVYERAVELDPTFALAWARLAETRVRVYIAGWDQSAEFTESARIAFERALELQPDLPEALIARANWSRLTSEDFAMAQRDLDRVGERLGVTPELRWAQRLLARDLGDLAGAARYARECLALDPENDDIVQSIGTDFLRAGDFVAADHAYTRSLNSKIGETGSAIFGKVATRFSWRGPEAALTLLDRISRTQGEATSGRTSRLRVLLALGRMDEARELSEQRAEPVGARGLLTLYRVRGSESARSPAETVRDDAKSELKRGNVTGIIWRDLANAEFVLGNRSAALETVAKWRQHQRRLKSQYRHVNGFHHFVIGLHSQLGQPAEDLALIEEYIAAGWHRGYEWRYNWMLEPLRNHPRFQEIIRQEEALARAQPDPIDP
jgi:TolB-like protein